MPNKDLIQEIKNDLQQITPSKNNQDIQVLIRGITRSINRLMLKDEKRTTLLRRFAVDLMQAYTSEVKFFNLNKPENTGMNIKVELSEGFFKSFEILKEELLKALDQVSPME